MLANAHHEHDDSTEAIAMTDASVAWAPEIPDELADVVTLLQHCPSCGYSLEGLPRNHREH